MPIDMQGQRKTVLGGLKPTWHSIRDAGTVHIRTDVPSRSRSSKTTAYRKHL